MIFHILFALIWLTFISSLANSRPAGDFERDHPSATSAQLPYGKGKLFSPHFRVNVIVPGENGQSKWIDNTPSKAELQTIEANLHVQLADRIRHLPNRRSKRAIGIDDFAPDNHMSVGPHDYEPFRGPETLMYNLGHRSSGNAAAGGTPIDFNDVVIAKPEVAIVCEYNFSLAFNFNVTEISEYVAVMMNYVNDRYANNKDPKVHFQLLSISIISDINEQKVLVHPSQDNNGKTDSTKLLFDFSKWAYTNRDRLGPHDVTPLVGDFTFNDTELRGIAKIGGACALTSFQYGSTVENEFDASTSLVQDRARTLEGAFTLAHELGHSLGAPHDGRPGATREDCTPDKGYVMSYEGFGLPTKAHFSPCSQEVMKYFIVSGAGNCVIESSSPPIKPITTDKDFGDLAPNRTELCNRLGNKNDVVEAFKNPDDTCREVTCYYGVNKTFALNYLPGNGMPCGAGGKCRNGYCINPGPPPKSLDELCTRYWTVSAEHSGAELLNAAFVHIDNDEACAGADNAFRCNVTFRKNNLEASTVANMTFKPVPFTPCDDGKVCLRGKCVVKPMNLTLEEECIRKTGSDDAKIAHQDNVLTGCSKGVKCMSGTNQLQLVKPNNGKPCDFGEGQCFEGECIELQYNPLSAHQLCKLITGTNKVKIDLSLSRDQICQQLVCVTDDMVKFTASSPTPDGVKCGPLRKCSNGTCKVCHSSLEDDIEDGRLYQ